MNRSPSEFRPVIDFQQIASRLGEELTASRLMAQADLWARLTHQGEGVFVLEHLLPLDKILGSLLKLSGFQRRAYRNFLDIRLEENEVRLESLPGRFDGYRILQISDLHCDLDPALAEAVVQRLRNVERDLIVMTRHGKLTGYTSRGTGSCGIAARFNCPPDITVHRLRVVD